MKRTRLMQRRKMVGLSQEALAEQLGIDISTVRRWEYAERLPQPFMRPNLAKALKVSVEELAALLGDADALPSDALCIPVPVEVIWPELNNGQPPESPHLRPWPAANNAKDSDEHHRTADHGV